VTGERQRAAAGVGGGGSGAWLCAGCQALRVQTSISRFNFGRFLKGFCAFLSVEKNKKQHTPLIKNKNQVQNASHGTW
jgi:hypothetical protein